MINMMKKTRDGKKSIAAKNLQIIAGLQDIAKESGTTISEVLRRGTSLQQRPAATAREGSKVSPREPSDKAGRKSDATPSDKAGRKSEETPSEKTRKKSEETSAVAVTQAHRPHSAPSQPVRPSAALQSERPAKEAARKSSGENMPAPAVKSMEIPNRSERVRILAASHPISTDKGGSFKPFDAKRLNSTFCSTPVQTRSAETPAESPSLPQNRSVTLFLDDEDEDEGSHPAPRPPFVRCNQLLTPKAIETRMLAVVEVNRAGGLPVPDPTCVTKPSTLTVEEMAERKRKRELLEAAEKVAARDAESGAGERDDGSLDLGWIGSKKSVRRSAVDAVGVVRNQRLAELFPDIAQVISTREGEEMLNRGSVNSDLALQVHSFL
jgi:hypothetical protein